MTEGGEKQAWERGVWGSHAGHLNSKAEQMQSNAKVSHSSIGLNGVP